MSSAPSRTPIANRITRWLALPPDDLWRNPSYRRLWLSILLSSFSGQITTLALALTAAVVLQATPTQIGMLGAVGALPFILFALPSGVWLDRVRKLPVYVAGEAVMALVLCSVPLVWALGLLGMGWMYSVAFVAGCVGVASGTAAQIVLTQVVPRTRLVEGHGRNALASSIAELSGPGVAGVLVKLLGAPWTLLINGVLLLCSVAMLRGVQAAEPAPRPVQQHFWLDLKEGVRFVAGTPLLVALALLVGAWQVCQTAAMVVQVLYATRVLGLSASAYGLCFTGVGVGTVLASALGHRISRRVGPGRCLALGFAISGAGWLQLALAPTDAWGVAAFVAMLLCFSCGTVLIFSNMLAMRQTITPAPLLARMTSTMRWLTLFPAGPGSLMGGYVGEHWGLHWAIGMGGAGALTLALFAWWLPVLRGANVAGAEHRAEQAR
jgi:MFS family permease